MFNYTGIQSDQDVGVELDAHQNLLRELLSQNPNLCVLVFGMLPRPVIPNHEAFLRRVNITMRGNVAAAAAMSGEGPNLRQWASPFVRAQTCSLGMGYT